VCGALFASANRLKSYLIRSAELSQTQLVVLYLQHPFYLSQLFRLHAHHSGERLVADSQVMHLTREVALFTRIRKRRHDGTEENTYPSITKLTSDGAELRG